MRAVSMSALVLCALVAGVSPLAAQRRELAVVVGGNFTDAAGGRVAKSTARAGFEAGLSLRLPRTPRFGFQVEVLVVQRRVYAERAAVIPPPGLPGPRADAPNLLYVQIPLLLRFQRGFSTAKPVRPFLVAGPYVAARLACRHELTQASGNVFSTNCDVANGPISGTDSYYPAIYQGLDAGLLAEVGVEVRRLSLQLRIERSFRDLVDPGAIPTSPLQSAHLMTGSLSLAYMLRAY